MLRKKTINLLYLKDHELINHYSDLLKEFKRRKIIRTNNLIGDIGEIAAIEYYKKLRPNLELTLAEANSKAFDAIDNRNRKYAIKATSTNVTGIFWGLEPIGSKIEDKRKFNFAIIVCFNKEYSVKKIYQISWKDFLRLKKWQNTVKAWNLRITKELNSIAEEIFSEK